MGHRRRQKHHFSVVTVSLISSSTILVPQFTMKCSLILLVASIGIALSDGVSYRIGQGDGSYSHVSLDFGAKKGSGSNSGEIRIAPAVKKGYGVARPSYKVVQAPAYKVSSYKAPAYKAPAYKILQAPVQAYKVAKPAATTYAARPGGSSSEEASYNFAYEVRDDDTYNYQAREENREGHVVKGQYQWVVDDTLYIVKYGDDGNGFYSNLEKVPQNIFSGSKSYGGYGKPARSGYKIVAASSDSGEN